MKIDIFGDGKFIIRINFPIYLSILNVLSYHFKRENCLYDFQPNSKYLYTCTNQCRIYPSLPLYLQKKRRYNIDTENGGRNIFVGLAAPSSLLIRLSTLMLDIACLFVCCFGCLLVFSQMPIMVWLFGLVCLRRTLLLLSSLFVIG